MPCHDNCGCSDHLQEVEQPVETSSSCNCDGDCDCTEESCNSENCVCGCSG